MGPDDPASAGTLYLDHETAQLLDELSAETRIAKAVLLREAVDDLLVETRQVEAPRSKGKSSQV